eukprot:TRINITY_DN12704_c0_g2_i1.p1 TRINITY_DN12704_c0_g2~~TRINITY_DN12704_c0_g2_i1.p1  ORF type:complete len:281 (+),score=69.32 TRINITY_DN12704_c0_g2_i1:652-1494(+)
MLTKASVSESEQVICHEVERGEEEKGETSALPSEGHRVNQHELTEEPQITEQASFEEPQVNQQASLEEPQTMEQASSEEPQVNQQASCEGIQTDQHATFVEPQICQPVYNDETMLGEQDGRTADEKRTEQKVVNDGDDMEKGHEEAGEEDEEDVEYIVMDMGSTAASRKAMFEGSYALTDLHTENPILQLSNGIKLIGEYVEAVGTTLLFDEEDEISGEGATSEGETAGRTLKGEFGDMPEKRLRDGDVEEEEGGKKRDKKRVKYIGKTTLHLKFTPLES